LAPVPVDEAPVDPWLPVLGSAERLPAETEQHLPDPGVGAVDPLRDEDPVVLGETQRTLVEGEVMYGAETRLSHES
jgi:hypothetical protein